MAVSFLQKENIKQSTYPHFPQTHSKFLKIRNSEIADTNNKILVHNYISILHEGWATGWGRGKEMQTRRKKTTRSK